MGSGPHMHAGVVQEKNPNETWNLEHEHRSFLK